MDTRQQPIEDETEIWSFHTQEKQSTKHKIGIHHRLGYTQSTLGILRDIVVP